MNIFIFKKKTKYKRKFQSVLSDNNFLWGISNYSVHLPVITVTHQTQLKLALTRYYYFFCFFYLIIIIMSLGELQADETQTETTYKNGAISKCCREPIFVLYLVRLPGNKTGRPRHRQVKENKTGIQSLHIEMALPCSGRSCQREWSLWPLVPWHTVLVTGPWILTGWTGAANCRERCQKAQQENAGAPHILCGENEKRNQA